MIKWKKEAILKTRQYNLNTDPEKYYYAKLLLYYPWSDEDELISGFNSYEQSYISKQHRIVSNANKFNEMVTVPSKWSFVLGRSHCGKRFPVMFKVL